MRVGMFERNQALQTFHRGTAVGRYIRGHCKIRFRSAFGFLDRPTENLVDTL